MGKNMKLPLENGFAALCNHIKAIRATAETSGSAVAALAESTAASLEEIDGLLDGKQEIITKADASLTLATWHTDTKKRFPWYCDITAQGVTADDKADVAIKAASHNDASNCGFCPIVETREGAVRVRAQLKPEAAIQVQVYITKGGTS